MAASIFAADQHALTRVRYNNPSLTVDLGVGLWGNPIPCDRNGDGRPDLIVVCEYGPKGSPGPGVYYFEHTGRRDPATGTEVFKRAVRLSDSVYDLKPSYTSAGIRVLSPGREHPDFIQKGLGEGVALPVAAKDVHASVAEESIRVNNWDIRGLRGYQWGYVDYDGNGALDLFVGAGDWSHYGWDDAWDKWGRWVNGPLHGYVYLLKNSGTDSAPKYSRPERVKAGGEQLDVYGTVSPNFADFDGDGDLDLVCGEFVDGITYFENIGTRKDPRYRQGKRLRHGDGSLIQVPLCMIIVVSYDWNKDGRTDLVISQEDGRVAWSENMGRMKNGQPEFAALRWFRQEADDLKFGVLNSPAQADWDGDGKPDLIVGNAAGEIAFFKNLGGDPPRWATPIVLEAGGQPIRVAAGYNGSIQGPAEAKWGYNNISVGDWNGDGLTDIMLNSIWGRVIWFKNIGTKTAPRLAEATAVMVEWNGPTPKPAWNWWDPAPGELVVEWRSTPYMIDLDRDGFTDIVSVDHEGYLALFRQVERNGRRVVLPGERVFRMRGKSIFDSRHRPMADGDGVLRLNGNRAGGSGRRTLCFADWDGDGKLDLLVNSLNVNFLRNISEKPGEWTFVDEGEVDTLPLAGHSTSPITVDWDGNGVPDLVTGAEDGFFYYLPNPRAAKMTARR
jgi:hypothetical protein